MTSPALRPAPTPSAEPSSDARIPRWFGFALAAAVFVAYAPVWQAKFIWDDDAHLTRPALRSLAGLGRIWFELGATQQYYPLLHSAFWLEHRLWGDAPLGYHLVNLAFHAAAAVLFARLLLGLAVPGALLASAIFALHPVHVESVAWITEQKNTLSTVFYLCAALAYLRFDVDRRRRDYAIATAFFVLGLLTKTVIATLPAALLVIFWWQRGRIGWSRDVRPLLPWFLAGALAGLGTAWVERKLIGAEGLAFDLTLGQRAVLAGRAMWFYAGKLLWPHPLTFVYPRWVLDPYRIAAWLAPVGLLAVALLSWRTRTRWRGPLAALLLFTGTLLPAVGFLNVYPFIYSFVADHFQYLASLAPIAFGAAMATHGFRRSRRAGVVTAAAFLLTSFALTWRQSRIYHDRETLFRATLALNPTAWMAHNNLGRELLNDRARLPEAIACFERALALRPDYAEALTNLGLALTQVGRPREAIPHLEASLRLKPREFRTHNNLGIAFASSGDAQKAVDAFAAAAALNPALPNIHENWAKALTLLGRQAEAAEHFAVAARLRGGTAP